MPLSTLLTAAAFLGATKIANHLTGNTGNSNTDTTRRSLQSSSSICDQYADYIGDGKCHSITNIAECGFDGGDCCEASCNHTDCGIHWDYYCMDPSINQYAPNCTVNFQQIGDGLCHAEPNNEECGFDGGDCCESTCVGEKCGQWGYNCKDPAAICEANKDLIGDGKCHTITNIAACNYDGGDCCEESCDQSTGNCGVHWDYYCMNPSINQYAPECTVNSKQIGDGLCHYNANKEECGYDGGDCCKSTCQGPFCGQWGYHCNDPNAS